MFQETLKNLRKEKNISQYDLAKDLNISRSVIAKWETGLVMPSDESIDLLVNYFGISKDELFKEKESDNIIVEKNVSIFNMKKIIIFLSTLLIILMITFSILLINLRPSKLSKQIEKLGDLEDVNIYLESLVSGEKYLLSKEEKDVKEKTFNLLNKIEYTLYSKSKMVEKVLSSYTIILEGNVTIYLNSGYLIIDGNNRTIKNWNSECFYEAIAELIASDSIEVLDEDFNSNK